MSDVGANQYHRLRRSHASQRPSGFLRGATAAGLLGAATGSRSQLGVAALAWTSDGRPAPGRLGRLLATRGARYVLAAAAAAELVADKLPNTPSRLGPPGLGSRIVLAAVAGAVVADRTGNSRAFDIAKAIGGAGVTAVVASRVRGVLSQRLGSDLPGAFAEDVIALGLAVAGARI